MDRWLKTVIVSLMFTTIFVTFWQSETISRILSWRTVYRGTQWYREQRAGELIFEGELKRCREEITLWMYSDGTKIEVEEEGIPPGNVVEVTYYWYFELVDGDTRIHIRTHGSTDRLEPYLGEWVQIKGKLVAITPTTHDVWPGKIRKANRP